LQVGRDDSFFLPDFWRGSGHRCSGDRASILRSTDNRGRLSLHSDQGGSTLFAVKQIADGLAAGVVRFFRGLALVGVAAALVFCVGSFRLTASGTAVGKAGLAGLQLELLRTNGTDFDGKCH